MRGVTIRANTSAGPPAANGTITVMGRVGYVCADASNVVAKNALKPIAKALIRMAAVSSKVVRTVARVAGGVKAMLVRHRPALVAMLGDAYEAEQSVFGACLHDQRHPRHPRRYRRSWDHRPRACAPAP